MEHCVGTSTACTYLLGAELLFDFNSIFKASSCYYFNLKSISFFIEKRFLYFIMSLYFKNYDYEYFSFFKMHYYCSINEDRLNLIRRSYASVRKSYFSNFAKMIFFIQAVNAGDSMLECFIKFYNPSLNIEI